MKTGGVWVGAGTAVVALGGAGLVTGAVLLLTSRGAGKPAASGRGPWMSAGVIGVGPAGATLGARGAW